jgi:hypothetical protein
VPSMSSFGAHPAHGGEGLPRCFPQGAAGSWDRHDKGTSGGCRFVGSFAVVLLPALRALLPGLGPCPHPPLPRPDPDKNEVRPLPPPLQPASGHKSAFGASSPLQAPPPPPVVGTGDGGGATQEASASSAPAPSLLPARPRVSELIELDPLGLAGLTQDPLAEWERMEEALRAERGHWDPQDEGEDPPLSECTDDDVFV